MTDDPGPARRYLQEQHAKQQPRFTPPPPPERKPVNNYGLMPLWLFAAAIAIGRFIIDPAIGRLWGFPAGIAFILIIGELWRKHRRRRLTSENT